MPPEGDWRIWLIMSGRGAGKTRAGAEWVRAQVEAGRCGRLALVAPTAADARDVMVEGESGILGISPDWNRPLYEPSKRRLTWKNGATATLYSADEPDRLRGPQSDGAWGDEIGSWNRPEAWDMLMLGLRLGANPRAVATTTPKPVRLIRELLANPHTVVTRGSTYDNALNLAPAFLDQIISKYQGTRLGRQEIEGALLEDVPGALWQRAQLDACRLAAAPELRRVVIALDPAATSGENADLTGIIVAAKGVDGRGYVLADLSCRLSPDGWARRAVNAYHHYGADRLIAEVNQGGEMVASVIKTVDRNVAYRGIHASRGKRLRAEPVAALYEQGRISHCGSFPDLEDQMCAFTADGFDGSPDRVDAAVYSLTELMLRGSWGGA